MLKIVTLLLLLPILARTQVQQPVLPILSDAYSKMLHQNSSTKDSLNTDTLNSIRKSTIKQHKFLNYTYFPIREINIRKNKLFAKRNQSKSIGFGVSYSMNAGFKKANGQPKLQNEFVQGRNINGKLSWQGAETNELFSFGPSIHDLQFDHSNYAFDPNGKLVPLFDGGFPATAYSNRLLQTGSLFSHSINAQGRLLKDYYNYWELTLLYNHTKEQLLLPVNKNQNDAITVGITRKKEKFTITGNYSFNQKRFSNTNQNGYLNRLYEASLLTPISFSNQQNLVSAVAQKSYSNAADNPLTLLHNNSNPYLQNQHKYSVNFSKYYGKLNFQLAPALESNTENLTMQYPAGTAGFLNGTYLNRQKKDHSFLWTSNVKYKWNPGRIKMEFLLNYNNHLHRSNIGYSGKSNNSYSYKRNTQDANGNIYLTYENYSSKQQIESGINFSNKMYLSTTANKNLFYLPAVSSFLFIRNLFTYYFNLKLAATYSRYANEIPIKQSFAYAGLAQLTSDQANQFLPENELNSFQQLDAIQHKDRTFLLEMDYKSKINFSAEWFNRFTQNDIFPVQINNTLQLRNIADHRTKGLEMELAYNKYLFQSKKLLTGHSITFTHFQSTIKSVINGYNQLPVAGFKNVHKAIINGASMGTLVGNSYLRNANNQIVIGTDGYPLVDNQLKPIGDAIPKFILKLNNRLQYRKFTFTMDWEWKNGGQIWNGTAAVLDYYGRSQYSAIARNTTNYIFTGVTANGQPNTQAVNFYDVQQPLMQNRWTRYGYTGVAENYIQKADQIKLQNLSFMYNKICKKKIQEYSIGLLCNNILVWSAYEGGDAGQLLFDQPNSTGLDFFNLPSSKYFGIQLTIKY